ncbi:MAG: hypothetical protein ACLGGX_03500 [Bdellovibrionia bacterium]
MSKWTAFACVIFVSFFVLNVSAEEKEAETKEEPAKEQAGAKVKEEEWPKVQAEVAALQAKIKQSEDAIKKLSEDKAKAPTEAQRVEISKTMIEEHKKMRELIKEYEVRRNYFLYRFPERGSKEAKRYQRIEAKPLEEIENQHTLGSKVEKTMKTVRKQYGSEEEKKAQVKKDKKKSTSPEEVDLTAPLILSK